MKKLLLTTSIFLGFGLLASAQEKKAATATTPAPATPAAAVAKQKHNQEMLLPKNNTEVKNQIVQDRENGVKPAAKKPANTAKKPAKSKAPAATTDIVPVVN